MTRTMNRIGTPLALMAVAMLVSGCASPGGVKTAGARAQGPQADSKSLAMKPPAWAEAHLGVPGSNTSAMEGEDRPLEPRPMVAAPAVTVSDVMPTDDGTRIGTEYRILYGDPAVVNAAAARWGLRVDADVLLSESAVAEIMAQGERADGLSMINAPRMVLHSGQCSRVAVGREGSSICEVYVLADCREDGTARARYAVNYAVAAGSPEPGAGNTWTTEGQASAQPGETAARMVLSAENAAPLIVVVRASVPELTESGEWK